MQRFLLISGIILLLAGILWPWLAKLPFGRLPGDFLFERPGFKLYVPFTSMLLISAVVTLLYWIFRK